MVSSARRDLMYDLLAPPLILATPFVSFVDYNDYNYAAPELWICFAALVAVGLLCGAAMILGGTWLRVLGTAGLLTLFVDLQFDWLDTTPYLRLSSFLLGAVFLCWMLREHLSRILSLVFATILASTVVLSAIHDAAPSFSAEPRTADEGAPANELPTVVHIIMDEHIGIEGLPTDVQHGRETEAMLKSFFRSYGFRLLGGAYSRYASTRHSVPNMLNYASEPLNQSWTDGDKAVILKSNKYFEDMHQAGYEIHVFQIAWLDLCKMAQRIIASCYTQDHTGLKALEQVAFAPDTKAMLLFRLYCGLSVINHAFIYWNSMVREFADRNGWSWPEWWLQGQGMPAIRAIHTLSILADEVTRSRPGQIFFAHVLIPHSPYIYDAECRERHPIDWEPASDPSPMPPNTTQSWARRYALYLQQVQCLYRTLGAMFERWKAAGLFGRLKIIIHGDHGSRIYLRRPVGTNARDLVTSDYTDAFSTLFAIKAAGVEPGYDRRMLAIQDLLPATMHEREFDQLSGESEPYVLLESDTGMVRQPMPDFGAARGKQDRLHASR